MSAPFWSVMIPTYNPNPDHLAETLRGVLAQDAGNEHMQIEVIDDASLGTRPHDVVRNLAGRRILVSSESVHLGLAGMWNRCIERARGQWIHILHQDDLVYPGFYQSLRTGVEAHPTVGAAFCRHAYADERGHWQALSPLELPSPGVVDDFVEALVVRSRIQCPAIVVRRAVYDRVGGFNPGLIHALDWEMWIRIATQFSLYYEPRILAAWRQHGGSATSRQMQRGENIRDIFRAISIWEAYVPRDHSRRLAKHARRRFAEEALENARRLFLADERTAAWYHLAAAVQSGPTLTVGRAAFRSLVKALVTRASRFS